MKTKKQIKTAIEEILKDDRYPKPRGKCSVATVFENSPLALIQQDMQSQVKALEWVLKTND